MSPEIENINNKKSTTNNYRDLRKIILIIDARTLPEETIIDSDICIVGAGAAGITLVKEFLSKSYRVCLLESGGIEPDEVTQSLSEGEDVEFPYFKYIKSSRSLGGNTNLWQSWCRPLDKIDFEDRSWVPYSGWPFTKQELIPYYNRAQKVCQLPYPNYDPVQLVEAIGNPKLSLLPLCKDRIVTKIWQFTVPPLRFGNTYKLELERANNIHTYLYTNVVEIETNDTAQTVTKVRTACINGRKFWVSSKFFILAMGGIEIPRLLLASNKVKSTGLGNQFDIVGRFFMEHPHLYGSGKIIISNQNYYPILYTEEAREQYSAIAGLFPSKELQESERILNYSGTLSPFSLTSANTDNLTDFKFPWCLKDNINHFKYLADNSFKKIFKKHLLSPLIFNLETKLEQVPDPNNRITLSREQDRLGVNKAKLNLQLSLIHKQTILRVQQIIDEELRRTGLGRLIIELSDDDNSWPPPLLTEGGSLAAGCHQMGTTRMHIDPKQGVVDENCRVHGISNLYIAGSSVFPTGGSANPTLTIVALAIRLADHIKSIIY
ncbi:MAG: GMC family oxidoreductase [Goleter apudmare HA4340-LM2]|jgi:choline dehydrogenase-like flavoprotein|nr:GMC family oxidoreductase [Goleter apudmare HA4340-LM2]